VDPAQGDEGHRAQDRTVARAVCGIREKPGRWVYGLGYDSSPMATQNRFKIVAIAVVATLVVVVILQNMETVNTRILFITISMPRAVLLAVMALIGFLAGVFFRGRRKKPKT
jgi:uncharacterized integral membrane protein